MQTRCDRKIITRGKELIKHLDRTDLFQSLCLLVPEREYLARRMASYGTLSLNPSGLPMEGLYIL